MVYTLVLMWFVFLFVFFRFGICFLLCFLTGLFKSFWFWHRFFLHTLTKFEIDYDFDTNSFCISHSGFIDFLHIQIEIRIQIIHIHMIQSRW